jgi:hypothetical protein
MKTHGEGGGIASPLLTSVLDGGGELHAPAALPQGKEPRCPLDRRLVEPQSRSGCCGEKKNLTLLGIEPRPSSL